MSLHDPARRPWRTARGSRTIALAAWTLVAVSALLSALWYVPTLLGDDAAFVAAIIAFNVSVFGGVGALLLDLFLIDREGEGDGTALVRLPGAWFSGAGAGAIIAAALAPGSPIAPILWGSLMLVAGALILISPVLLGRCRDRRAESHQRTRSTGIRTQATVTRVRMFTREHFTYYRVTMRFRDQSGDERWFTRTAAPGTRGVSEGMTLALHYDPAAPGTAAHARRGMAEGLVAPGILSNP